MSITAEGLRAVQDAVDAAEAQRSAALAARREFFQQARRERWGPTAISNSVGLDEAQRRRLSPTRVSQIIGDLDTGET